MTFIRPVAARHTHGADAAMMTDLGQTMLGEMLDGTVAWFFGTAVWILIEALIGLPVIGLRIVHRPGTDLILVDPHLGVSDPGRETI